MNSQQKFNKFSIKKCTLGVMSVCIGSVLFLSNTSDIAFASEGDTNHQENTMSATNQIEKNEKESNPEILSITLDKHEYAPGEVVKVQFKIKDINKLENVSIGFSNDTAVGETTLAESLDNPSAIQSADGVWTVNVDVEIPKKIGDTSFSFSTATVDNVNGGGDTIAPQLGPTTLNVQALKFSVKNKVNQDKIDTVAPQIKNVSVDKNVYKPGETVNATVMLEDISKLREVSLSFGKEPFDGKAGISKFADVTKATRDKEGKWIVPLQLQIPKDNINTSYQFAHVSAVDEFGNSVALVEGVTKQPELSKIGFKVEADNKATLSNKEDKDKKQDNQKTTSKELKKAEDRQKVVTVPKKEAIISNKEQKQVKKEDNNKSNQSQDNQKTMPKEAKKPEDKKDASKKELPKSGEVVKDITWISAIIAICSIPVLLRSRKRQS